MKMKLKHDPMYKNFKYDITPEGLTLAFNWISDATRLGELDKDMTTLRAHKDIREIWPEAKDQEEAMAMFQERAGKIKDPEKLKVYLCRFLLDLAVVASTWVEGYEKAGMNESAQRMFG